MITYLLCFLAGAATAVAGYLGVTGIRADRREWRRLDAVQAELADRYRDTRTLGAPTGPAELDERPSIWRTLASRGEEPGDPGYPPPPPIGEYRDPEPDEPDGDVDDEDQADDDDPVGPPPVRPGMVLPWRVLTLDALLARPARAAASVNSPNDPLQPVVWAPWGRHRPEAVRPLTGDARDAYDEAAVLTHGHHGQHLTTVLRLPDLDGDMALFGGAGHQIRHHTRNLAGAAA